MPQRTCQVVSEGPGTVVRISSFSREDQNVIPSMGHFVFREFMYWKRDLQNRKKEGKYYQDLLYWLELNTADSPQSSAFMKILHFEIPNLNVAIEKWNSNSGDFNMKVIQSMQKNYYQLCKRYDQIKMMVLDQLVAGQRFEIY